jgi:hypothetical protein
MTSEKDVMKLAVVLAIVSCGRDLIGQPAIGSRPACIHPVLFIPVGPYLKTASHD